MPKLKYKPVLAVLQKLINEEYSHSQLSKLLIENGLNVTSNALSNRYSNDGYLKEEEIEIIEKKYNINLLEEISEENCIEIEHIHIGPSCGSGTTVLDEPEVTPIKLGTQMIQNILKVTNPSKLKTFRASGDSMEPIIEDSDILLVDTGRTDYQNGGIFILTINNDWFVKRLRLRITGELDIISDNPKYPTETLKPNSEVEIIIRGKVLKNLSRGL